MGEQLITAPNTSALAFVQNGNVLAGTFALESFRPDGELKLYHHQRVILHLNGEKQDSPHHMIQ